MANNQCHTPWLCKPIGDLLDAVIDYRGKTPPKSPQGIPTVTAANVRGGRIDLSNPSYVSKETYEKWITRGLLKPGDVLITTEAPVGEVASLPGDQTYLITRRVIALRGKPGELDNDFLKYSLLHSRNRNRLLASVRGSTVPRVLKPDILGLEIPIPPYTEQIAIVSILKVLDDKIELNDQINQTLEAIARAVFKSWFVDFDPVWAKMDGQQPPSMDAATASLFPAAFIDSPLGPIPQGWQAGTVGEDFNITMGQSPPGETYNEDGNGPPFYQGRRDFGFRYPSVRVYCSAPTRFAKSGDTLVSVRAPVGDINMAIQKCCVGRGVAAVRHKTGSRSYTYYAMQSLRSLFDRFEAEGTVFGSLSKRDFHSLPFVIPPPEVVKEYEAMVFPVDESIETNEQLSQTLAKLRDALLPKLISGQLRIPDAERYVEDVL